MTEITPNIPEAVTLVMIGTLVAEGFIPNYLKWSIGMLAFTVAILLVI